MHVCPPWLSFILYNPIRKALTDREKVLDECGISIDSVVLEVGPGNGFLTEAIAGRAKKVYSVELQEGMVRKLQKRVERFGDRVEIISADVAAVTFPDNKFDVCLLYYSFHEIGDKPAAAEHISEALKSGGALSIYEPSIEVGKKAMAETIGLFLARGFEQEKREDGLITRFARLKKKK